MADLSGDLVAGHYAATGTVFTGRRNLFSLEPGNEPILVRWSAGRGPSSCASMKIATESSAASPRSTPTTKCCRLCESSKLYPSTNPGLPRKSPRATSRAASSPRSSAASPDRSHNLAADGHVAIPMTSRHRCPSGATTELSLMEPHMQKQESSRSRVASATGMPGGLLTRQQRRLLRTALGGRHRVRQHVGRTGAQCRLVSQHEYDHRPRTIIFMEPVGTGERRR